MLPLFKTGDIVLVSSLTIKKGDCAVYDHEGRTLLHRVVDSGASGLWFADDAGRIAPHLVPWSAVRGKVVGGGFLTDGLPGFLYSRGRTMIRKLLRNFRKDEG